jgi:hypothetical protein
MEVISTQLAQHFNTFVSNSGHLHLSGALEEIERGFA